MRLKVIYILAFLAASLSSRAHEPGLSTAILTWRLDHINIVQTFAVGDMDNIFMLENDSDGKVSQLEFSYGKARIASLASNAVDLMLNGQKRTGGEPSVRMDDLNN